MMKKIFGILFIAMPLFFLACDDSEDVTPSMADKNRMDTLFDTSIPELVAFKDVYGTYILYQFDPLLDFAYQFEEAASWRSAQITFLEKEEVKNAFAFLQQHFISCYRDTIMVDNETVVTNFKKEYFPRKFLICNKIQSALTLGISKPEARLHSAVANVNSFTIAGLDKATLASLNEDNLTHYLQQIHYIYLAGYVVNSRRNLFVPLEFFDACNKLYGTKIDRTGTMNEDYFMKRGFFFIEARENYYPQQVEDLEIFIRNTIKMTAEMLVKVHNYPLVRNKVSFVVAALSAMGVDVVRINPLLAGF